MTVCLIVCLQTQNKEVRIIPRVWGQGRHQNGIGRTAGIIRTLVRVRKKNHPHACGDKWNTAPLVRGFLGSSPRVWGQAAQTGDKGPHYRIIPTRVGTRSATGTDTRTDKDHPHACGDKFTARLLSANQMGSSPRVWGQESAVKICYRRFGIIPTRVGTSYDFLNLRGYKRDHPHACGDKKIVKSTLSKRKGSSPRVWGQAHRAVFVIFLLGIIPTRVGTSPQGSLCDFLTWDHPHACGDKGW